MSHLLEAMSYFSISNTTKITVITSTLLIKLYYHILNQMSHFNQMPLFYRLSLFVI